MTPANVSSLVPYLRQLRMPASDSHKGQNGKVLIIGGSELFHAASQWAFRVASRLVDMTFYCSVAENNELLRDAKFYGQDGVIVRRQDLQSYAEEADVILIGPGMQRSGASRFQAADLAKIELADLLTPDWEHDTRAVTAALLRAFPQKKWVIDAGALQVLHPSWLPRETILTPHQRELTDLLAKLPGDNVLDFQSLDAVATRADKNHSEEPRVFSLPATAWLGHVSRLLNNATIIRKGEADLIWDERSVVGVRGGNAGLTKGGTGDVLAGLTAALWTRTSALPAVTIASYLNKASAHDLYQKREFMFNTSDLVEQLPLTWNALLSTWRSL